MNIDAEEHKILLDHEESRVENRKVENYLDRTKFCSMGAGKDIVIADSQNLSFLP